MTIFIQYSTLESLSPRYLDVKEVEIKDEAFLNICCAKICFRAFEEGEEGVAIRKYEAGNVHEEAF
jgi:hypothetical protein